MDSHPNKLELSGEKFNAYLHDEGLDDIIKLREGAGMVSLPGRERYRRDVKTILSLGAGNNAGASIRTGQKLEIIPKPNTLSQPPGAPMRFQVLFEDKPLINRLVKAWYKHHDQTIMIRARTNTLGQVSFNFPYAGPWMLSIVHMMPVKDSVAADWDSFWGNLTFSLPSPAADK